MATHLHLPIRSAAPEPQPPLAGDELLGGLDDGAWDALAGRNFYASAGWLRFCDLDYGPGGGATVAHGGDGETVALPWVRDVEPGSPAYRWDELLAAAGLPAPPSRGLLVGAREGYQTTLLSQSPAPADEVVAQLVAQLRATAQLSGDGTCVAMYASSDDALALHRAGGSVPVFLELDAWLAVPEGGWPAWLESLPSRHRRKNIRQEAARFERSGQWIEQVTLADCVDQLGPLASGTQSKYGHDSDEDELLAALRNHADWFGDRARVALCHPESGPPVGFCLYYLWGDSCFARWAGFDYERLAGAAEYFNLVYYAQIQLAETLGIRWLHAGIKSPKAKALRGAELRPLWLVDLTPGGELSGAGSAIRQHNRRAYERLLADQRIGSAIPEERHWLPFL